MKSMKKIYIGNMSFSTTEERLLELFSKFGEVSSVTIKKDQFSELSKGFGFVEMADDNAAIDAVSSLNGKEIDGRNVQDRRRFFEKKKNMASNFKKGRNDFDNSNEF